ncbi:hypothetical protein TNCV_4561091 [Trichonephila clavipes]|nr:hypothetical protein TNCV_4561091 [Trichonephila clavipes]
MPRVLPLLEVLHQKPQMCEVCKPNLTRDCKETPDTDATCCNCQGNHPANYSGCPKNPLNKPPPPPKVNFWEERTWKRKEMMKAEKFKSHVPSSVPASQGNNSSQPQPSHSLTDQSPRLNQNSPLPSPRKPFPFLTP